MVVLLVVGGMVLLHNVHVCSIVFDHMIMYTQLWTVGLLCLLPMDRVG